MPTIYGTEENDTLFGTAGDDMIYGLGGHDVIDGGSGGNDILDGGDGNDRVTANGGSAVIYGGLGDDLLIASNGNHQLFGGDGNDVLRLVSGTIYADGGLGNDIYQVWTTDHTIVDAGGTDSVETYVSITLSAGIENLTVMGISGVTATGNELDNIISGNEGSQTLNGMGGNDYIYGGAGNDIIIGGTGADRMEGGNGADIIYVDSLLDSADGGLVNEGNTLIVEYQQSSGEFDIAARFVDFNYLEFYGNFASVANVSAYRTIKIEGSASNSETVLRNVTGMNSFNDLVEVSSTSAKITLTGPIEIRSLTGGQLANALFLDTSAYIRNPAGNFGGVFLQGGDDTITFSAVANGPAVQVSKVKEFDGGTGNDTLILSGPAGSGANTQPVYIDLSTTILTSIENIQQLDANAGVILTASQLSSLQSVNIANLRISGTGTVALPANGVINTLQLGNASNTLNLVGAGVLVTTIIGGTGNDSYSVNPGTTIVEAANGGYDSVFASGNYVLAAGSSIELLGTINNFATTAINLTGNELANYLAGNAGSNILDGAGGSDWLDGREGDDQYYVDGADSVFEAAGGGYDAVFARDNFVLTAGAEVELLGTIDNLATTAINLTGNEFANYLAGNAGNNILNGAGGSDWLDGREGDDQYYVDGTDSVFEAVGGGYDIAYASEHFILTAGAEVEVVGTIDNNASTAINLTGNELNNGLSGNAGANVLNGMGGNDYLQGRGGADIFAFSSGSGNDTIVDFTHGEDRIDLSAFHLAFADLQTLFVQHGADGSITLASGESIYLYGVNMSQLNAGDFIL